MDGGIGSGTIVGNVSGDVAVAQETAAAKPITSTAIIPKSNPFLFM
jgi:hypothetical protein